MGVPLHPCCYLMPSFNALPGLLLHRSRSQLKTDSSGKLPAEAVRRYQKQKPPDANPHSSAPQRKRVARPGSGHAGLQSVCIFCMIEPRRISSLLLQSQSFPSAPADCKLQPPENTHSCTCCFLDTLLSSTSYKSLNNKTVYFYNC